MKIFFRKIRKRLSDSLEEVNSEDLKKYSSIINNIQIRAFLKTKIQ